MSTAAEGPGAMVEKRQDNPQTSDQHGLPTTWLALGTWDHVLSQDQ